MENYSRKLHTELVSECIWYLKQKGFINIRREEGIVIPGLTRAITVDIMTRVDGKDVPVECGSIGVDYRTRLGFIFGNFEYFYWYPYSGLLIKMSPEKLENYGIPIIGNEKLTCCKCGHSWNPKIDNPKACPMCKSRNWIKKKEVESN